MTPTLVHRGMNLTKAIRAARERGFTVERRTGTGELFFSHPRIEKRYTVDAHRKDTPWGLAQFLQKVEPPAEPSSTSSTPHPMGTALAQLIDETANSKSFSLSNLLARIGVSFPLYKDWKDGKAEPGPQEESRILAELEKAPNMRKDRREPAVQAKPAAPEPRAGRWTASSVAELRSKVAPRIVSTKGRSTENNPTNFAEAAGVGMAALRGFLEGNAKQKIYQDVHDRIEAEARKRGWLDEPVPATLTAASPLETLHLSNRAYNALLREDIKTVGDLCRMTRSGLALLRGVGDKIVDEVEMALARHGRPLRSGTEEAMTEAARPDIDHVLGRWEEFVSSVQPGDLRAALSAASHSVAGEAVFLFYRREFKEHYELVSGSLESVCELACEFFGLEMLPIRIALERLGGESGTGVIPKTLTNWMRANVLHGVLLTQLTEAEKRQLIDALFSQWQR